MRAKRIDGNHKAIKAHLRERGWCLHDTSAVGGGFGDFVVSRLGHTAMVEAKDGKNELNKLQREFRDKWQGAYFVVRSPDDAEKQLNNWLWSQWRFKA